MSGSDEVAGLGGQFVRRVLFVAVVAGLSLLVWRLSGVLLLLFGAVIVAVLLRSVADPIARRVPVGRRASLALATLVIGSALALVGWLFGAQVSAQTSALADLLPRAWTYFEAQVLRLPGGDQIVERMEELEQGGEALLSAVDGGVLARVTGFVQTAMGAAVDLLLVVVAGVYFALRPDRYRDGVLLLVPPTGRERVANAVEAAGQGLRRWLLGALVSMTTVGLLVGLGAWAIGLPSPLALGLLAGLAEFVPIVGPVASAVPGVLLGLSLGPETALWALALYVGVQQLEANLITPLVQKRAADLPPVLTLFAVVSFGVLFGPLGVVLATPLAVVALTLVKSLYLRDVLGEDVPLPEDGSATRES